MARALRHWLCLREKVTIHEEIFDDMVGVRRALLEGYRWLTHDTALQHLESVRRRGLVPHFVMTPPQIVFDRLGPNGSHIICLHPVGSDLRPRSSQEGPFIRLGMQSRALPCRIGLDWSYDWNLAEVLRRDYPNMSARDIFVSVARRRGSVVSYDRIAPSDLRIYGMGSDSYDPSTWSSLGDVPDAAVATF